MRDKHSDIIRVGKVSSIDYEKCTAQVVFEDRHDLVSGDLHILVPLTLKDHAYYMPDIDERVLCIFDPSAPTKGYIVASFYADTRLPPIQNKDKRYIKFKDKTLIEYDRDIHKLTIDIPEANPEEVSIDVTTAIDINVLCNRDINIYTERDVSVYTARHVEVFAAGDMKIHSVGPLTIDSDTSININAPVVHINDKF